MKRFFSKNLLPMTLVLVSTLSFLAVNSFAAPAPVVVVFNHWTNVHDASAKDAFFKYVSGQTALQITDTNLTEQFYQQKVMQLLLGGVACDVHTGWWEGTTAEKWETAGLWKDVTGLVKQWNLGKAYLPYVIANCSYKGKQYQFPVGYNTQGVFYNKHIFDNLGLTAPTTWSEFLDVCQKIKDSGVTPIAWGATEGIHDMLFWWDAIIYSTVGDKPYQDLMQGRLRWDAPAVVKAHREMASLFTKGYFLPGILSFSRDEAMDYLVNGKAAMAFDGDYMLVGYEMKGFKEGVDVGWFTLPAVDPKIKPALVCDFDMIAIPTNAPHPEAAIRLAQFWTSKAGDAQWGLLKRSVPTNMDSLPEFISKAGPVMQKIAQAHQDYSFVMDSPNSLPVGIQETIFSARQKMVTYPEQTEQLLGQMADKVAAWYAQNK